MLKKAEEMMKKQTGKAKNYLIRLLVTVYVMSAGSSRVYAFQGSIYETGTKKMMKDLLSVGQGILAAVVLVLVIVWELQKRASDDNEESRYGKKQRNAVIGLIVAETIGTLFGIIGGYYGVSIS